MHKGHGNTHTQRKRYRRNFDPSLAKEDSFECIDGNYTHYPYAWCKRYDGFLTKNMAVRHQCDARLTGRCCDKMMDVDDLLNSNDYKSLVSCGKIVPVGRAWDYGYLTDIDV